MCKNDWTLRKGDIENKARLLLKIINEVRTNRSN